MLFNSFIFIFFLAVLLPLYYLVPQRFKNPILLLSSYIFYAYWDWRFCSLLLISSLVDFIVGRYLYNQQKVSKRKLLLFISIFVNLGILASFKYFNFFIDSFEALIAGFGSDLDFLHIKVILPVGISFYTFQSMSYTIDIYRKKLKPTKSIVNFALFVSFFPQLVAGPIERASSLLPQLEKKLNPTKTQIKQGIVLIITGLFKKVMIGDTCGRIVDQIFSQPQLYTSGELLFGLILFAIQIYSDFSGYSYIARGTAKLLGKELMINFRQPYLSSNITELWKRWHISLATWLRDYVYISLGGNKKGKVKMHLFIIITMLLCGLWHGADWTFVIWGGINGLYLSVHKLILKGKKEEYGYKHIGFESFIKYLIKTIFTFLLFLSSLVFVRSENINDVFLFCKKMINWESGEYFHRLLYITLCFLTITALFDFFEYFTKDHTFLLKIKEKSISTAILSAMLLVVLIYLFQASPMPFVYFQF